jgi:hypothetical protein
MNPDPDTWLKQRASGFGDLSAQEKLAIMHFSFLWSFFEATALNTRASSRRIRKLVCGWAAQNRLDPVKFSKSLAYFKSRYLNGGEPTPHFQWLNLRKDDRALVEAVLSGENTDDAHCVAALLIVIYRLRNNLLHGVKWDYGIRDQLDNFTHANDAIMAALEIHGIP